MNNTITNTSNTTINPIHPSTTDAAFFQLIGDIDVGRLFPNRSERRTIEWARFAGRLRATGHRVTIGGPA